MKCIPRIPLGEEEKKGRDGVFLENPFPYHLGKGGNRVRANLILFLCV
jgi:hypothetical protein